MEGRFFMLKKVLVSTVCALTALSAFGSEIIVKLNVSPDQFLEEHQEIKELKPLVKDLDLYLAIGHERAVLDVTNKSQFSGIEYAMNNDEVKPRMNPNDPELGKQWAFEPGFSQKGIDATDDWSITTGGMNVLGQDIVVAVVDGGVDVSHKDLAANIWVNQGEIPGNGIDDDGNGYVDDINGWNAISNNNSIPKSSHGTHVAGTVGAVGNNGIGVTGVNWNVKIMAINGSTSNTAQVLRAYGYVLKQKKLWIETNGEKGANVVVTNSSFGIDGANCNSSRYKAWNDMYNEMGKYGILSAAATANRNWDIDRKGDVPTGCSSPYVIAVTNTTNRDKLNSGAGYGKTQIDIGAPGTSIHSTTPYDRTGSKTGTSMATPHIAGTVALMHAAASTNFAVKFDTDPAAAALDLKQLLLDTAKPISALKGKTVSGGRLDLGQAVLGIHNW